MTLFVSIRRLSLNENDGCCKEKPSVCKFSSCCEHITVFPKKQEKFGAQTIQEITELKMLSQLNGERESFCSWFKYSRSVRYYK